MAEASSAEKKRELILVIAGMLALVWGYGAYWRAPRVKERIANEQAAASAQTKLAADEKTLKLLEETTAAKTGDADQDTRMGLIRQANDNFSNIVRTLSGDGMDAFTIKNLSVEKEEKMPEYTRVLFNLEVDAPFLSVGKFLEKIEKSELLAELVSIEVNRTDPEVKRCTIKVSIYGYAARN